MKENAIIKFRCSSEDKEKIKKKAKKLSMTTKQYLLYLGKNVDLKIKVTH